MKKLAIRYLLEFIVIVVGISFSFWIDEWNRNRIEKIQRIKDIESILDDLDNDSLMGSKVYNSLKNGDVKTKNMLSLIELKNDKKISYKAYTDSIINLGFLYTYQTFFMTDATYKSLISNGRINLFPQNIHSEMNNYYEATSKRIFDNNHIVDNIALKYYNEYHPFSMLFINENNDYTISDYDESSLRKFNDFFKNQEIKRKYQSIDFYINTYNLRNRILVYSRQIANLRKERNSLSESIKSYLETL